MWPGIRPATDGWRIHLRGPALEQLGQLAHRVLGLGDGEPVARDHDDLLGVGQLDRRVVRPSSRTVPPGPGHRPPTVPSPPPKPPIMMFRIERFMASAMSLVRMAPEAPTRAPAMISTGLPRRSRPSPRPCP